MIRRFLAEEDGQVATEWALVIALVSVALLAALYTFNPQFRAGIQSWGGYFETAYGDGQSAVKGG